MADTATPTEVFHRLLDVLTAGRFDEAPALYAQDAYVRHMFGQQASWRGREELRAHFRRGGGLPIEMKATDVVVQETADPEVVVGEWIYEGRNTATGQEFRVGNLIVMRVRDGLIVESRDYHDPTVVAAMAGS